MGNIRPFKRRVAKYHTGRGYKVKIGGRRPGKSTLPWRKNRRRGGGSRNRIYEVVKQAHDRSRGH